jgi:5-methyltetrahydrofolate--homocysteine methyltransferase
MMGVTAADAMALARDLAAGDPEDGRAPADLLAVGANCGIGPPQLLDTVLGLASAAGSGDAAPAIVAKGNCGIPQWRHGHIHYDGTPEIMADYALLARDAGARIIGGCCGTTADHIRAMVAAVAATPKGPVPERAAVEARLGPIAAPAPDTADTAAGTEDGGERRPRRRRRATAG